MRWRSVLLTACSGALAVTLTGCGGNDGDTETVAAGPRIERATAEQLASLSDQLAEHLEGGDSCSASKTAARLRDALTAAINDGKVPEVYLEDLSGLANEIEVQIPKCAEPTIPPPRTTEDEDDRKRKDKDKDDEDDGEETTETIPDGTTTTETETETGTGTTTETVPTDTTTTTTTTPTTTEELP
jgi:hypothetical protein